MKKNKIYNLLLISSISSVLLLTGCKTTNEAIEKDGEYVLKDVFGKKEELTEVKYKEDSKYNVYKELSFNEAQKKAIYDFIAYPSLISHTYLIINELSQDKKSFNSINKDYMEYLRGDYKEIKKRYKEIKSFETKTKDDEKMMKSIEKFYEHHVILMDNIFKKDKIYGPHEEVILYENYINAYKTLYKENLLFSLEENYKEEGQKVVLTSKEFEERKEYIYFIFSNFENYNFYYDEVNRENQLHNSFFENYGYNILIEFLLYTEHFDALDSIKIIKEIESIRSEIKSTKTYKNNKYLKELMDIYSDNDFKELKEDFMKENKDSSYKVNLMYNEKYDELYNKYDKMEEIIFKDDILDDFIGVSYYIDNPEEL